MDRRYYDRELQYLNEAGEAFAEVHPEIAAALGLSGVSDQDPYVERLLEGFAFLAGRIHQRLDDEFPQYTEGLLELVQPQSLRPVPAQSVVELAPKPGLLRTSTTIPAGFEIRASAADAAGITYRFQTTRQTHVHPITLADTRLAWEADGTSTLALNFALHRGVALGDLDLEDRPLRLYFYRKTAVAQLMREFCTHRVDALEVRSSSSTPVILRPGSAQITPVGLAPETGAPPESRGAQDPVMGLRDYFCFPQGYGFVDLHGADRIQDPEATAFTTVLRFSESFPKEPRIRHGDIRLHCVPVVNSFEMDVAPIRVRGHVTEHRVHPGAGFDHIVPYDVTEVVGTEDGTGRRLQFRPYFSFQHVERPGSAEPDSTESAWPGSSGTTEPQAHPARHFTLSRRRGESRRDLFISLNGTEIETLAEADALTLTITARCTNGIRPHASLREGEIWQVAPGHPQTIRVTNLIRPTPLLDAPDREQYYWLFLSHLAYTLQSITTRDAIQGILRLYDWSDAAGNRKRIAGIQSVHRQPKEIVDRGSVIRGAELTLTVQGSAFSGTGDVCLFGDVLSTFLSQYVTINSFLHLTIEMVPSGRTYRWHETRGVRFVA